MKTAILIATYNEASNIKLLLEQLSQYDVYVIDDNSPDGTAEIANQFDYVDVTIRKNKKGIASAYIDGFKKIIDSKKCYDFIVQMDAGLTHDPNDIPKMLDRAIQTKSNLVIGSRNISKQKIKSYRTVISKIAVKMMNLLGIKCKDATSGFRAWDINLLKKISFDDVKSKGFSFQLELLHQSYMLGSDISEHYIEYKLTNSSFSFRMLFEATCTWFKLLYKSLFAR